MLIRSATWKLIIPTIETNFYDHLVLRLGYDSTANSALREEAHKFYNLCKVNADVITFKLIKILRISCVPNSFEF